MLPNCPLVADIRLKRKAASTIMSYDPIWLKTGLEIVLGERTEHTTSRGKSTDVPTDNLKAFVSKWLLGDPQVTSTFGYKRYN